MSFDGIIVNKYQIEKQIGKGVFGYVYQGFHLRTREKVAIKMEPINKNQQSLKNETRVYQYLNGCPGVAKLRWFGTDSKHYYLVIDLLGMSLSTYLEQTKKISLPLIFKWAVQMITILESIHDKGMIHRDIKPDNFLMDPNTGIENIYLIDFGFCKTFLKQGSREHIETGYTTSLIGTPTFASIRSHENKELSRRDDLESIAYVLIFLYLGYLPWSNVLREKMMEKKRDFFEKSSGVPQVFLSFLKGVQQLGFKERPFYDDYKKMFV